MVKRKDDCIFFDTCVFPRSKFVSTHKDAYYRTQEEWNSSESHIMSQATQTMHLLTTMEYEMTGRRPVTTAVCPSVALFAAQSRVYSGRHIDAAHSSGSHHRRIQRIC